MPTTQDLPYLLNTAYAWRIDSFPGVTTAQTLGWMSDIAGDPQGPPDKWLIELGGNDLRVNDTNYPADLARELSIVGYASCVVLVVTLPPSPPGSLATQIRNDQLTVPESHPNVRVLDWGSQEYADPAWLQADYAHPTAKGQLVLAEKEVAALNAC